MEGSDLNRKVLSVFGQVASSIGYSPLHGKIIAVLAVRDRAVPLQEIAKETGYSISMVSLSLDLLEVLGVIRKVKKSADRKLYIELNGDLLEILKNAIVIKVEKSVSSSLSDLADIRSHLNELHDEEKDNAERALDVLEPQLKRLNSYVGLLSKIRLP
jgi:DNA-binding transcriptional regulator GbsR (MarR family)